DQQPAVVPATAFLLAATGAHQRPRALELAAFKNEVDMVLVRLAVDLPVAGIPEHHGAAAVLTLRDHALEAAVIQGVILHLDGKPSLARFKAWSFRQRPAPEHAVLLQPEVEMVMAGGVLVHDIKMPFRVRLCVPGGCRWLAEGALAAVLGKPVRGSLRHVHLLPFFLWRRRKPCKRYLT